jgi:Domain of unknown function (DUF4340)
VVAAAVTKRAGLAGLSAAIIILLIGLLALAGGFGGADQLGHFDGRGIAKIDPGQIIQVDWRRGDDHVALHRSEGGAWSLNDRTAPKEVEDHIGAALNFVAVSEPARALGADELNGVHLADFGLAPAAYTVALRAAGGSVTTFDFGELNPVGVSQYVRIDGRPQLYLLPRYVGSEWAVAADQALRLINASAVQGDEGRSPGRWLLSVSIDQIWSVDIAVDGKVHRLERDAAGNWLLRRSGQKAHAWSATSLAEPEQARRIATTLAALEQAWASAIFPRARNTTEIANKGSESVLINAQFYARDNTVPVAKFEIGSFTGDDAGRLVRIDGKDGFFGISASAANYLDDLLKSFGNE